jgi:UDP-N-acetyl-D-galactosamine dehydrogenase
VSLFEELKSKEKAISVTGLGYVGLPLALEFAKYFRVIGFDINVSRIAMMRESMDPSKEISPEEFKDRDITFTSNPEDLKNAHFHIVAVPTDIDDHKVPDLTPLIQSSQSIGRALKKGDYVVYESTVYPGCTEEDCLPELEKASGLKGGKDFKYGYSPERVVPGDKVRTLPNILKIVSGNDAEALEEISKVYGTIIHAGLHRASTIKVAEAAKVIENTQRDLNISLMNELAIIFDRMGIDTREVLEAAGTKWNFHKYYPGLVGGHCISVDPFYLMHKARELGYEPQVIAAGRRINDYMPHFIAKKLVQTLIERGKNPGESRVLIMGITFKEDVADIRNSKVVDLIRELEDYSVRVDVFDPHASAEEVMHEYGIELKRKPEGKYNAIVVAVGHDEFKKLNLEDFAGQSTEKLLVFDVKGALSIHDKLDYLKL